MIAIAQGQGARLSIHSFLQSRTGLEVEGYNASIESLVSNAFASAQHALDFLQLASLRNLTNLVGDCGAASSEQAGAPVGHVFALATIRLEDAQGIATAEQNPRLTPAEQKNLQRRLLRAIERCRLAAERIAVIEN